MHDIFGKSRGESVQKVENSVLGVCLKCIGRYQSVRNSLMQVAVRKPSKGTSIALWQNDFCAVSARKWRVNAAENEVDIYQALEFRKGFDMPLECRAGLSEKEGEDIWIHGVYYAPSSVIRRANVELRKDASDDWEPCPQYKAALGKCPELVRVENC